MDRTYKPESESSKISEVYWGEKFEKLILRWKTIPHYENSKQAIHNIDHSRVEQNLFDLDLRHKDTIKLLAKD
jgi:hypothetical protein